MSVQGTMTEVSRVAKYVAAELRHEEATQQARVGGGYRPEYIVAAAHRIEVLRDVNAHLQAALVAVQRLAQPAARAASTTQPADSSAPSNAT